MIGAAMAGGNPRDGRQEDDWYPTPPDVTEALMRRVRFTGDIWEPCCGDGSMSEIVKSHGYSVFSSDIVDRGYGDELGPQCDILSANSLRAENIITNPPFFLAADMIIHLMSLKPRSIALLLKATYWHADERAEIFDLIPPSQVLALTWRPDFMVKKRPTMEFSWFVWEAGVGSTSYGLLRRPDMPGMPRRKSRRRKYQIKMLTPALAA